MKLSSQADRDAAVEELLSSVTYLAEDGYPFEPEKDPPDVDMPEDEDE